MEKLKLKILLLADHHSANTQAWVKNFLEFGCEVRIVSARARKSFDNVIALGLNFLPPRLKFISGTTLLRKIIKKENPDILIGYRITSYGYLAAKSGFHPLVLAAQNENIVWRKKILQPFNFFLKDCAKFAIKNADLIHAWSENIKEGVLRFGADEKKILVMHRGIDLNIFYPKTKSDLFKNPSPVLISTRSLFPEYRHDLLLHSFSCLLKIAPSSILKIIGDGPELKKLTTLAKSLSIHNNVVFYGHLDQRATAEQLRNSDIYISLIQTEGFSSSLLEACACGIYPIVSDISASRQLIADQINGTLIKNFSPENIAKSISSAFMNQALRMNAYDLNPSIIKKQYNKNTNTELFIKHYLNLQKGVINGKHQV